MADEKYITVHLSDYLSVNGGKIAPDREAIFSFYERKWVPSTSIFGNGGYEMMSVMGYRVTRVRKHPNGYSGMKSDGKRIVVAAKNATIEMPLAILKEKPVKELNYE